jgi:hypothetical protein
MVMPCCLLVVIGGIFIVSEEDKKLFHTSKGALENDFYVKNAHVKNFKVKK